MSTANLVIIYYSFNIIIIYYNYILYIIFIYYNEGNLLKKGDSLKADVIGEYIEVNPVDAELKSMFSK